MQPQQPFRLMLIFNDQFATLQAVPPNGVTSLNGRQTVGGMVQGKEDLLSLISDVGINSVVQTQQLNAEPPRFRRIFNLQTPSQIIDYIGKRFAASDEAEMKIILAEALTERDDGPALDGIVLGATKLSPCEGVQRVADWFERKARGKY